MLLQEDARFKDYQRCFASVTRGLSIKLLQAKVLDFVLPFNISAMFRTWDWAVEVEICRYEFIASNRHGNNGFRWGLIIKPNPPGTRR
ncbi:hypothetical protein GX51_04412 [Blastomyces parvus]|uniref:Uncharacterized protein n=1 Tax=Blastomyces parvus TaxID=2060905 RepID=A0A2B7X1Y9_9EURO|nr:hypothetical protein GX51_04412 [Blastomyces parvus]